MIFATSSYKLALQAEFPAGESTEMAVQLADDSIMAQLPLSGALDCTI